VLHDGALLSKGMPRFPAYTEEQVGQIHAFIRSKARGTGAAAGGPLYPPMIDLASIAPVNSPPTKP
jgi:hypothetical protein